MPDRTKVCALCGFYNEMSMNCERFPPNIREKYVDNNENECACWYQPFIENPLYTRCGEWQEINDPVDNDEHPDYEAAFARLNLIVQEHAKLNKKRQRKNNVNRDGT